MYCAISGTTPVNPVVSSKSGLVYERDVILKYLNDNDGKDPITGELLSEKDLVTVKTANSLPAAPPRPPNVSSIPALLHVLQSEWDSTMLDVLQLRKTTAQLRQELSHALYKEDAAMRVLARVLKERDEAREALANVQASLGIAPGPRQTGAGVSADVEMSDAAAPVSGPRQAANARVESTAAGLSAIRHERKKLKFEGYSTADDVKAFTEVQKIPSVHGTKPPGVSALDVAGPNGELVLTGGLDKNVLLYDRPSGKNVATLKGHTKRVTSVAILAAPTSLSSFSSSSLPPLLASTSLDKSLKIWSLEAAGTKAPYKLSATLNPHAKGGEITGLAVHPSGTIVATAASDGTWALVDVSEGSEPSVYYEAGLPTEGKGAPEGEGVGLTAVQFHPDGGLLAVAGSDGIVRVFDVRTGSLATAFSVSAGSPLAPGQFITSLSFSENGYVLSLSLTNSGVSLWDLRKPDVPRLFNLVEEETINEVRFDKTGGLLVGVGSRVRVWAEKGKGKERKWEEVWTWEGNTDEVTGVRWSGEKGEAVVVAGLDRTVRVLGKAE